MRGCGEAAPNHVVSFEASLARGRAVEDSSARVVQDSESSCSSLQCEIQPIQVRIAVVKEWVERQFTQKVGAPRAIALWRRHDLHRVAEVERGDVADKSPVPRELPGIWPKP